MQNLPKKLWGVQILISIGDSILLFGIGALIIDGKFILEKIFDA